MSVTIEMDLNQINYSRSRYTAFDLLSDVGGLSGMFASIFTVLMGIWNFNAFDAFLVSNLFKIKVQVDDKDDESKKFEEEKIKNFQTP